MISGIQSNAAALILQRSCPLPFGDFNSFIVSPKYCGWKLVLNCQRNCWHIQATRWLFYACFGKFPNNPLSGSQIVVLLWHISPRIVDQTAPVCPSQWGCNTVYLSLYELVRTVMTVLITLWICFTMAVGTDALDKLNTWPNRVVDCMRCISDSNDGSRRDDTYHGGSLIDSKYKSVFMSPVTWTLPSDHVEEQASPFYSFLSSKMTHLLVIYCVRQWVKLPVVNWNSGND